MSYSTDMHRTRLAVAVTAVSLAVSCWAGSVAAQEESSSEARQAQVIEEVFVTAQSVFFGNNLVTDAMKSQQSPITSVNALIDNLPGVSIQEGDTYGFDDWSTTISVRGFQTSLAEQQIGTTIDGMPNGNSNYGGGSKANRFVDTANVGDITVSQGTADIGSRSLEALGGTIDYQTSNPESEQRFRAQGAIGEFDAQRYYLRYDTGEIGGNTRAWISFSQQEASDWVNGAAENERDHFAAKLVSELGVAEVTAYVSYDDIHEDNYQRLFTAEEFSSDSEFDRLTDEWTGVPYVDQVFRRGWSTLRENLFGYVKADFEFNDSFRLSAGGYYHDNEGRGDWVPPYLVDVRDDMGGPESENLGGPGVNGGPLLGLIFFVDPQGNSLSPAEGCESTITFPYGGAGPEYDPNCYPADALAVQSYRTTNYAKERVGFVLDGDFTSQFEGFDNTVRGGIWYEDQTRDETRTWQRILDTRVGPAFDGNPYWTQYDRTYPQEALKWYLEDTLSTGPLSFTAGIKQFLVDVERQDNFGETTDIAIDSDSDVLFSGGLVWQTPVDGLEAFAGFAENFKAISDVILERPESDLSTLNPETAENIEVGLRYRGDRVFLTATYYDIDFSNRIIFLPPESASGPDYIIGDAGTYFNAGGIESNGFELTADLTLTDNLSLYSAYTYNDSTYVGTGDPLVDEELGITPGNDVVGIADQQLVVSLDWSMNRFAAGVSAKYTGERPIRFDNSWVADEYTTADIYLTFMSGDDSRFVRGWNVTLLVNNAFDEDFLGGISGQGAWIGPPRTVSASFTLDL
ncbi:MAG: TonB-dependent receptor [Pseudomonadota bacterium]